MKTRKARGQVRRFFRRGIACLLACLFLFLVKNQPACWP